MLFGCGGSNAIASRPSWRYELPEEDGKGYAIAYDSRGRGAYLSFAGGQSLLCAEPPPDTSANYADSSSSSASGSANVGYSALTAAVSAQGSKSDTATSTVADVVKRSELNLLVRDIFYRLCEMQFNGNFKNKDGSQNTDAIRAMFQQTLNATLALGERDNVAKLIELAGTTTDEKTKAMLINAASQAILGQIIASPTTDPVVKANLKAFLQK